MLLNYITNIAKIVCDRNIFSNNLRCICTSYIRNRDVIDRKEMLRSLPALDEGTVGEKTVDIDSSYRK